MFVWPRELDVVPREISRVELDEFSFLDFLPVLMNNFCEYHSVARNPLDPSLSILTH